MWMNIQSGSRSPAFIGFLGQNYPLTSVASLIVHDAGLTLVKKSSHTEDRTRWLFFSINNEYGEWGRLHNAELHGLYRSPNIVRVIKSTRLRWAGNVARMGAGRTVFKLLTGTPTWKRHLGRPIHRCQNNIRMDLQEIGINAMNLIDSAQDMDYWKAIVNAVLTLLVP